MNLDSYRWLELADHEHLARGMGVAAAQACSDGDRTGHDVLADDLADDLGDVIASAYRRYGAEAAAAVFAAFYIGQLAQFQARSLPAGDWQQMRDHFHQYDGRGLTPEDIESIRESIGEMVKGV